MGLGKDGLLLIIYGKMCYWKNLDLHLLNIDFKQAYYSTNRTYLHEILKDFGVPKKLAKLRKMTL